MSVVLVTGARRGIGAAVTGGLVRKGHTVYAGMRDPDGPHALDRVQGDWHPVRLDVTQPDEIDRAVEHILARSGRIDALVNNAGVAWFAPAEEMSDHVLRTTMETNFFGAVACTQSVLPAMRRQESGKIIMISSLAAATGLPLESAYCASKSALEAFSESLRLEVDPFGIAVSVVEPGITEGGLSTSIPDPVADATRLTNSVYRELLEHTFAYYDAAQRDVESAQLVVEAVTALVAGTAPGFRHRLGRLAPAMDEIGRASDEQGLAMLRGALGIEWWQRAQRDSLGTTST